MSDRPRSYGQHASLRGVAAARPEIGEREVAFALERRPRTSWQHLARQLGVNAQDLQRACERPPAAVEKPAPARAAATYRLVERGLVRRDGLEHRILAAIRRGVGAEPRFVAQFLAVDATSVVSAFGRLRDKGLLVQPRAFTPADLTELAFAELERLDAETPDSETPDSEACDG